MDSSQAAASSDDREGSEDEPKQESEPLTSLTSRAPKLSSLPPSAHVPSLEGNVEPEKEGAPAILNIMKDSPNVMTSSVILSNLHTRRMSAKAEGGLLGASFSKGGASRGDMGGAASSSILLGRRHSQNVGSKVKGTVEEVTGFTLSGSELIRSKVILAASMGTNHTALLTSTLVNFHLTLGLDIYIQSRKKFDEVQVSWNTSLQSFHGLIFTNRSLEMHRIGMHLHKLA